MPTIKTITSRDNPAVKALRVLAGDPRAVRRQCRTLIDGPHLVGTYRQRLGLPQMLVVAESALANAEINALLAASPDVDVLRLSDSLFREISGVVAPVGILAVIAVPAPASGPIVGDCVILDTVQDAGNVGAILRSAAAAGVRDIVLGTGCAGAWTPRVLRAAQGAHFSLRIREQTDLAAVLRDYPGTSLATVVGAGGSLYELDLRAPVGWIFGNEGAGVSPALARAAARRVTIPLSADSESLNVAAAAAICLFEGVRQRQHGLARQNG
jgi:TrmH family RNA methyltransferase